MRISRINKTNRFALCKAQMAFVEAGNATVDEVFLPYLRDKQGQTLYQAFCENRLMLPGMEE